MSTEPRHTPPHPSVAGGLFKFFRPMPPAAVTLTDPAEIKAKYRFWQLRVLIYATLGYAMFYFVRKNLSIAMPFLGRDLGIDKEQLGLFLTLHGVIYGISKCANGYLADRANACVFMSTALLASAALNVWFGLSSTVLAFGLLWMANGWFQGMGFPPCARLMANWFPPKELATKFSIWNSSHNIGSILILLLCGFLVTPHLGPATFLNLGGQHSGDPIGAHNWRLCFLVPAVIAAAAAVSIFFLMPDTPPSVGLPEVEGTGDVSQNPTSQKEFKAFCIQAGFWEPLHLDPFERQLFCLCHSLCRV